MPKRFPVGTIRHWQVGDVIKAFEPMPPFSNGWIPLVENAEMDGICRDSDAAARAMSNIVEPINGIRFLDHTIDALKDEDGKPMFKSGDFKVYNGLFGAGAYSFRSVFYKRFMHSTMEKEESIFAEMVEENQRLGGNEDRIVLSNEAKRNIRMKVRKDWKDNQSSRIIADCLLLSGLVRTAAKQVNDGIEGLTPEDKGIVMATKAAADDLWQVYDRIKAKDKYTETLLGQVGKRFADNWGLKDYLEGYITDAFLKYTKKYSERIKEDSKAEMMETFHITHDMGAKEFYGNIIEATKDWKEDDLEDARSTFSLLVKTRLAIKYDKTLEGEWEISHAPYLMELETAVDLIPSGHFKTNADVKLLTRKDFNDHDTKRAFAFYDSKERAINLSSQVLNKLTSFLGTQVSIMSEVILHEIGHAVSNKFGRAGEIEYKKFVFEAGWSYLQDGIEGMGPIDRGGSNAYLPLISDYSSHSPEECWAEYYSFYAANKEGIDKFIDKSDVSGITTVEKITAGGSIERSKTLGEYHGRGVVAEHKLLDAYKLSADQTTDKGNMVLTSLISPWDLEVSKGMMDGRNLDYIKSEKDNKIQPPIIVYRKGDKVIPLNGVNYNEINKMNRRMSSCVEISEEKYNSLKDVHNLKDHEIVQAVVHMNPDIKPLMQVATEKLSIGLQFCGRFVDKDTIKSNLNIFKQVRTLYSLDRIQKTWDKTDLFVLSQGYLEGDISEQIYDQTVDFINKSLPIGTVHVWSDGQHHRKTPEGWVTPEKRPAAPKISAAMLAVEAAKAAKDAKDALAAAGKKAAWIKSYAEAVEQSNALPPPSEDLERVIRNSAGLGPREDIKVLAGDGDVLKATFALGNVFIQTDDGYVVRRFYKDEKVVEMKEFFLNPELAGTGKGARIFYNQVMQFKKLGYITLKTYAAEGGAYNGYYTWARLGYDLGTVSSKESFMLIVSASKDKNIKSCRTLPELMSFYAGRKFWKEHGTGFHGLFDLRDNSESMYILEQYMKTREDEGR